MPEKRPIDYVPRPERLQGLRVGLVENTKHNSKTLLLKIADRLNRQYGTQTGNLVTKASAGHPVSDSAIRDFADTADVVVAGIGD